jgi:hypothetical protein
MRREPVEQRGKRDKALILDYMLATKHFQSDIGRAILSRL